MTLKGSAGTYSDILKKGLSEQIWLATLADEIIEKQEEEMEKAKGGGYGSVPKNVSDLKGLE